MPVIVIPKSVLLVGSMPQECVGYIDQAVWSQLLASFNAAESTANLHACAIEIGVCLFFAFPCIFCCHPCINDAMRAQPQREALSRLNHSFYGGRSVFSAGANGTICINTDLTQQLLAPQVTVVNPSYAAPPVAYVIQQPQYGQQPQYAQQPQYGAPQQQVYPAVAVAQPVPNQQPEVKQMAPSYPSTPPTPVTPQQQPRVMVVRIPEGVPPGGNITVQSPDGVQVSVAVPAHMGPGQEMQVHY